jgi:hypothetical protein
MSDREILKSNIQKWISLDEKCKLTSTALSEMRKGKQELEKSIVSNMERLSLQHKTLVVDDKQIQLKELKQYQSISISFLKKCLGEYFDDEDIVNELMGFIKEKRECKINSELKFVSM